MRLSLPLIGLIACNHEQELAPKQGEAGTLELVSPAAAAWMDVGRTTARGNVTNIEDVVVAGDEARVHGGEFEARIELARGVNVVEAAGTDARGHTLYARHGVLAGDFATPEGEVEDALALRVNRGGLDRIAELAEDMVGELDIGGSLAAINPVYVDSYGVWGWDAVTIAADVTSVAFDAPRIEITPDDGTLTLTATLPDLYVSIVAYGEVVGIDFDTDVAIGASEAVITGVLEVGADDGRLDVSLEEAEVELRDFWYDTTLLPDEVESVLLVDTVRDTLEEKLVEQIETSVPPLLDATLAGLDPSFSFDVMGLAVDLGFVFAEVDVDEDGLALALDLDLSIPPVPGKEYAGYLHAGDDTAEVDTAADVAGAVSDNLLNRLLFEAWRAGFLDLTLSTTDGSLDPALIGALKAEEATISVNAVLPPVAVEEEGSLHAQMAEVLITIDTPGGELGEHLVVALAADIDLDLTVDDGVLALEMGEPEIVMMVRESDWGGDEETITNLLEEMVPLDSLLVLLGAIEMPLPSLYGLAVDTGTAVREDTGVHTGLEIWLD
ncbi:MAG: hypothetical protein ACOZNI_25015 [Myxococcota bacterium]